MCPERRIISLFYDDELPSPWKEKMAAHLESCPECRAVLAGYGNLKKQSEPLESDALTLAQERVWEKLASRGNSFGRALGGEGVHHANTRESHSYRRTLPFRNLLHRNVTLPLPAAATAALAVAIAFFAVIFAVSTFKTQPEAQNSVTVMNIGMEDYAVIPVQSMADVLRYLSLQDDNDFTVIQLPEHRSFTHTGQPALINASDYSRTTRRTIPW
jgi:hypothetical protein